MNTHKILLYFLLSILMACVVLCGMKHANTSCNTSAQDDSAWGQGVTQSGCVSCSHPTNQSSLPQVTTFTDYVYEEHSVFTFSDTIGFLRQLDIEFPTDMKNKKVLAKIQEQLIDTMLHTRHHTSQLDEAMAKYWRIEPDEIERNSTYSLTVLNDSDEYFDYGGVPSRQFEHLCGRT